MQANVNTKRKINMTPYKPRKEENTFSSQESINTQVRQSLLQDLNPTGGTSQKTKELKDIVNRQEVFYGALQQQSIAGPCAMRRKSLLPLVTQVQLCPRLAKRTERSDPNIFSVVIDQFNMSYIYLYKISEAAYCRISNCFNQKLHESCCKFHNKNPVRTHSSVRS